MSVVLQVPMQSVWVAGLFRRALAFVIDLVVLTPVLAGCAVMITFGLGIPRPTGLDALPLFLLEMVLERQSSFLLFIFAFAWVLLVYHFLFVWLGGATMGLRALGLRVITEQGEPPSRATAVVRTLALIAAALPLGLGLLWVGFDREKRGLHDHLARTYVVLTSSRKKGVRA